MGNDVIVVSIHMTPDPLVCNFYSSGMVRWLSSLPSTIYNRKLMYKNTDMYHATGFLERAMLDPTTAMVTAEAELDGNNVNMHADIDFAADYDNSSDKYRVGFTIVDKEYAQGNIIQRNSCTLLSSNEYYYLPQEIPGSIMKYHDLPIEGSTMLDGVPGSLPAEIKAGGKYTLDYQLTLPDNRIFGTDSLCVVTTVFDSNTGEVLNATSNDIVAVEATGIKTVAGNSLNANITKSADGNISISLPGSETYTVSIISLDGRVVRETSGKGSSLNLNCSSLDGCYIIQVTQNGNKTVKKIIL